MVIEKKTLKYTKLVTSSKYICFKVMPTSLRGTGTALASIMSMLSQMASPYIVFSVSIPVSTIEITS